MSDTNHFTTALNAPLSAKQFVLLLFGALDDTSLPISKLVAGAGLFDIEETAVRVAVNRLMKGKVLESATRGSYTIGNRGRVLYEASRAWRLMNDRLLEWDGSWFCVVTAHLGRTDRKALRTRDRALRLHGFATLEDGFWVRPANLAFTIPELASSLGELGLSDRAIILRASELGQFSDADIGKLWDREQLEAGYRAAHTAIETSEAALTKLPVGEAAKQVLHIGSCVVSILTHDPLLPSQFVNAGLREDLFDAMLHYDARGKVIWAKLFADLDRSCDDQVAA